MVETEGALMGQHSVCITVETEGSMTGQNSRCVTVETEESMTGENSLCVTVETEASMEWLGRQLAQSTGTGGLTVALQGTLGAGKTTFTRGFLRQCGHLGTVKSPTFTLVEPYDLAEGSVYHFDLYRLLDPTELEWLGVRDYFSPNTRCLVEWPERGVGVLPIFDLQVTIHYTDTGRLVELYASSARGHTVLEALRVLSRNNAS